MEDSLINIDECEAFSLSSDTDIKSIVDQWKCRDKSSEVKDLKQFDTRTFTRPKKKLFATPNNDQKGNGSNDESSDDQAAPKTKAVPRIDLKIGGLVTSMQRSFLGDVSPPPNMDSSMGNSLITSMDFTNVNEFINGTEDSLSMANFNQYRLSDAINDRNFLERLTNYDESLFTKDADINNIDGSHLISNGTSSSGSTLQNSTDSTKNDETFVGVGKMNGTFMAVVETDRTFIQAPDKENSQASLKNGTFDFGSKQNATFPANQLSNESQETADFLENENISLQGTFNLDSKTEFKVPDANGLMNVTKNQSPKPDPNPLAVKSDYEKFASTPARDAKKNRQSMTLANISPILSDGLKRDNSSQNVDKFIDVDIESEFPEYLRASSPSRTMDRQISNPSGINYELREKQRLSLAKFEDFENTLLILENNKSEEELDDLLNSFNTKVRNPLSEKVRQSLDNIKKRHSMLGMEKQQQDELSREKTMNASQIERNRLDDSLNRSAAMVSSTASSGSGCGERLLRRSRVFDDVINTFSVADEMQHTKQNIESSIEISDNRHATELNTTEVLNKRNQSHLNEDISQAKTDNTMIYNTDDIKVESKSNNNRDRFKTIRIFKKPPENAYQVPDVDDEVQSPQPSARSIDVFATKNTNSPKVTRAMPSEENRDQNSGINTMTFKRSALARPKQLSGLQKRDLYTKSNSQELLTSDARSGYSSKMQSKPVAQIKSPMGIKSKSIHNLNSFRSNSIAPPSRTNNTQSSTSNLSSNTFRMPTGVSGATMRHRADAGQPKKLTLIRPSSGYYGYNTRRTDSDTESAKFSSSNSLSSGSSKSSVSRGETPETFAASNENPNTTFVQPSLVKAVNVPSRTSSVAAPSATATTANNIVPPRASLLRPPTQIRKSGLPRPMTYTKR